MGWERCWLVHAYYTVQGLLRPFSMRGAAYLSSEESARVHIASGLQNADYMAHSKQNGLLLYAVSRCI